MTKDKTIDDYIKSLKLKIDNTYKISTTDGNDHYTYSTDGHTGGWSSGPIWVTDHTHMPYNPGTANGTWTSGQAVTVLPPGMDAWPLKEDALGVVFIDGDEIKIVGRDGREITIGRLDDSDDFIPIEALAAKKKLLEE
mgnify:CR=1 FL=1|jgi:hypothetical protein